MDDLEFRRTVMAEPNSKYPETQQKVQQAANSDSSKQAFLDEMRQFDDNLSAALKVDVPENLSERLILRQTLESHNHNRRRTYSYIAIAASIAFTLGLSFQFLALPENVNENLGTHSLNHLAHERGYLATANEINTLAQVNSKLARFGGQMKPQLASSLGEPVFVNYCDFAGVTSLHLIYQTPEGRMSVFVAPSNSDIPFVSDFSDDNYIGKGLAFSKAHISVLGKDKQAVQDFSQKVEKSIDWSI